MGGAPMSKREQEITVEVGISPEKLATALRELDEEDREWFLENLLAATSPAYIQSFKEAREDYRLCR